MAPGTFYVQRRNLDHTSGARTQNHHQGEEEEARKRRRSRCLLLMTGSLGLICVVLLIFITRQHFSITAERNLFKSTVEKLKKNISGLQHDNTHLKNNFSSLSLEKLKLETTVRDHSVEKNQLQREKQELQNRITTLGENTKQGHMCGPVCVFISPEEKSWSDSRKYCRDHGADLVIIKSEEKQRHITSLVIERVWIGLSDIQIEGNMTWVDNTPLNQGFWFRDEPNDHLGIEDCIELIPPDPVLNNWNDMPCSTNRKAICEK